MSTLEDDPVIRRIREVRHQISEEFGHDPRKLLEHYMRLQEQHRDRFFRRPVEVPEAKAA